MHLTVCHVNQAVCAVTGAWLCNGMVDAQYDVRRSSFWICAESSDCVSLENGAKIVPKQKISGIPVVVSLAQSLVHALLQAVVQNIDPRPAHQLLGTEVTQVFYNCMLAVREDAHRNFLKHVSSCARAVLQHCLQTRGNAMEEAISFSTDLQAANFCANACVCADERVQIV